MNITEQIVYILRKTSLTLKDIGKLSPTQFNSLLKELYYQESIDEYRQVVKVAEILAAIYNTIPRKRGSRTSSAKDFIQGEPPLRDGENRLDELELMAKEKGIILPSK